MSELITGLVGVAAGSFATGGVQAYASGAERRLRGRTAARVVGLLLFDARISVSAALQLGEWNPTTSDWREWQQTWAAHQEPLAQVLSSEDFRGVALVFRHLHEAALMRHDHLHDPPPPGFDRWSFASAAKMLEQSVELCDLVEPHLEIAGMTGTERLRRWRRGRGG